MISPRAPEQRHLLKASLEPIATIMARVSKQSPDPSYRGPRQYLASHASRASAAWVCARHYRAFYHAVPRGSVHHEPRSVHV